MRYAGRNRNNRAVVPAIDTAIVPSTIVPLEDEIRPVDATTGYRYTRIQHIIKQQCKLTSAFAGVGQPAGLVGIELLPHQRTVIQALLDIEYSRTLHLRDTTTSQTITRDPLIIRSSAAVLSEPFGSGKTVEILSLIVSRQTPRAVDVPIVQWCGSEGGFLDEVYCRFTGPNALIRPNLIVVGNAVVDQWHSDIKTMTNLQVMVVSNADQLKQFQESYTDRRVNAFDIVLLKNGPVTGRFNIPGFDHNSNYSNMITLVGAITADACWSRAIYDDFDIINIPKNASPVNALFTIYVSATMKADSDRTRRVPSSILDVIKPQPLMLSDIRSDKLMNNFNICNVAEFTNTSSDITVVNIYRYVYDNPDDNYIRLLGAMGAEDAREIMEMMNGDAVGTAAERLGIVSSSAADIFRRVLDKKYEQTVRCQRVLTLIGRLDTTVRTYDADPDGIPHTLAMLDSFRADIVKLRQPNFGYYHADLDALLRDLRIEYDARLSREMLAIDRVRSNIREGDCQVCRLPLDGEFNSFILRCCGVIVCDDCGIRCNRIKYQYDYKQKTDVLCGSCTNCKQVIYPDRDLIFVNKDFDLRAAIESNITADDEPPVEHTAELCGEPSVVSDVEPPVKPSPKLDALVCIIEGRDAPGQQAIELNIKNLIRGRKNAPAPPGSPRKVLVFANFTETLDQIEKHLIERGIKYYVLRGTSSEKTATVRAMRENGQVLLINSQQSCAGLNLQFASDLVYYHKILDVNIESQVGGRIQRIGRTYNARIHYLFYKNEGVL